MQRIRLVSIAAVSKWQKFWDIYGGIHRKIGVYQGEDVWSVYNTNITIPELAEALGYDITYDLAQKLFVVQD